MTKKALTVPTIDAPNSYIVQCMLNNAIKLKAAIDEGLLYPANSDVRAKYGLCKNILHSVEGYICISNSMVRMIKIFKATMSFWHEYSGNSAYPIKSYTAGLTEATEYYTSKYDGYMYNPHHPYGQARLRLLDFLIESFTKMLEADKSIIVYRSNT